MIGENSKQLKKLEGSVIAPEESIDIKIPNSTPNGSYTLPGDDDNWSLEDNYMNHHRILFEAGSLYK